MLIPYASKGKRLGAFLIDTGIGYGLQLIGGFIGGFSGAFYFGATTGRTDNFNAEQAGFVFALILLLAYGIYSLYLWSKGLSIGKMILKLRVIKDSGEPVSLGTMLLRNIIGKLISSAVLMIGYLWIIWDKDNQGWHDKIASTIVIDESLPVILEESDKPVEK